MTDPVPLLARDDAIAHQACRLGSLIEQHGKGTQQNGIISFQMIKSAVWMLLLRKNSANTLFSFKLFGEMFVCCTSCI
jgi:hypothetical protein